VGVGLKGWIVRGAGSLLALLLVALGTLMVRALVAPNHQIPVQPVEVSVDTERAATHLAQAVRIATVSRPERATAAMAPFHAWLQRTYPQAHRVLERTSFGDSLLYTWPGSDPSLEPIVLLAHQDVVPIEEGTETDWTHAPFSGDRSGGFIWGRGTMDDKGSLVAIMEAVEDLIAGGHQPTRSVLLGFGHDEEVGGTGAEAIAAHLRAGGVRPMLVLDEGMPITQGLVPGLPQPVALIGLSERGYLSLQLTVVGDGGHASMPPPETPIGILAAAVVRLEADPFDAGVTGPSELMFRWLAPHMVWPERLVFANLGIFEPLVLSKMTAKASTNASVRTTLAPTVFHAGTKDNVLAQEAVATVNLRLHPRDSRESATERVRRVIDDPRVVISTVRTLSSEPSPVSSVESKGFRTVQRAIHEVYPDVVVAPSLVVGATDSRWFADLSDSVYRFFPMRLVAEDLSRIHGTDERLAEQDLGKAVIFYRRLIEGAS
jgi:carboxypeptidase PM20D1